jgi:hypothetical protein
MANQPVKIFISYSHKDEALREDLEGQLAILKNLGKVRIWQDRAIKAGDEWNEKILNAIDSADIILLLVSPRFMASDFCFNKEMPRAMLRHEQRTARVIPIILAPCPWQQASFARLGVLPTDGKPVTDWSNTDSALHNVAQGITRVVDELYGPVEKDDDGWGTPPSRSPQHDAWGTEPSTAAAPRPQSAGGGRGTGRSRGQLFRDLASLPGPQFEEVLFSLNPPAGNVPGASAPQANRVTELLQWAESLGPGLGDVEAVLSEIIGNS